VDFIVEYLKERQGKIPVFGVKAMTNKDWFEKPYAEKYWFFREIRKKDRAAFVKAFDPFDYNGITDLEIKDFLSKDQDWDLQYCLNVYSIANYMQIPTLMNFCQSYIGYKFMGNTPGDIRRMLDVDEEKAQMCIRAKKSGDMKELKERGWENDVEVQALMNEFYALCLQNDEDFTEFYKQFNTLSQTPGQVHRDFNKVDLNSLPNN
jgi:hypothetical protein